MFQFDKSSSTETVKTQRQSLQNVTFRIWVRQAQTPPATANSPCNIQQVIFIIGPQATINPKNLKKCSAGTITPPFPIAANNMKDFHVPMMKIEILSPSFDVHLFILHIPKPLNRHNK